MLFNFINLITSLLSFSSILRLLAFQDSYMANFSSRAAFSLSCYWMMDVKVPCKKENEVIPISISSVQKILSPSFLGDMSP